MNPNRLPTVVVFDGDGNEVVGAGHVLAHLPPSRRPWHERLTAAPPPCGQFNGAPVWLRRDVETPTLFPNEET
jgi:hypothetical protein